MSLKDVSSLASAFGVSPQPIKVLKLADCGISSRGVASIMEALEKNIQMSAFLKDLDMSGNKFEEVGSSALAGWISVIREKV